jgi:uncharacterized protein YneF (UPF0154 family)
MIEELLVGVLTAIVNGAFLTAAFYIGYTKGTRKAVQIAIEEIEKHLTNKPEIRLILANLNNSGSKPPIKKINKMNEQIENVGREKHG